MPVLMPWLLQVLLHRVPPAVRHAHDIEVIDGPHVGDLDRCHDSRLGKRSVVRAARCDGAARSSLPGDEASRREWPPAARRGGC